MQRIFGGLVVGEAIERAGNVEGDASAHEDVAHAGEHGSIEGGQVRELHLFEVVDANGMVVAFAGEKDFNKVGCDAELGQLARFVDGVRRRGAVGRCGRFAAGNEVRAQDALGHLRKRKGREAAAHMAAGVAILEAADEDLVECGAGNDAELAEGGDGLSETPAGYASAHTALNDDGILHACRDDCTPGVERNVAEM
jgi:hypothetical protein